MILTLIRRLAPLFIVSFSAGLILAILGPYGTHSLSLPKRLLFWVGLCIAGGLGAGLVDIVLKKTKIVPGQWGRVLLHSIGSTLLVFLCFLVLGLLDARSLSPAVLVSLLFYIWVISIVVSAAGSLNANNRKPPSGSPIEPPEILRLKKRLKPKFRDADIYALAAEDHYVRVITSQGEDLILMRLSDAIDEVGALPGVIPHRSWWVAENGVEKISHRDGKTTIHLISGHSVPVSRSGAKRVRDAQWR